MWVREESRFILGKENYPERKYLELVKNSGRERWGIVLRWSELEMGGQRCNSRNRSQWKE